MVVTTVKQAKVRISGFIMLAENANENQVRDWMC